ncbi:MAG: immunoglobulin domain-containing protein [Verrucomicrobiota bacterium]
MQTTASLALDQTRFIDFSRWTAFRHAVKPKDSPMPLMQTIRVLALVIGLLALLADHGVADNFKHISIDGSFDDWAGVVPAYEDPADATGGNDLKTVYVAHDERYFYVRFALYSPGDPFTSQNNVFIDANNDATTGYAPAGRPFGSELLIQSGVGYQEKNGLFNEGPVNGLDWAAAPAGAATDFEFRIARSATYASDNTAVFSGDTIAILLETENAQFTTIDTAPDTEGLSYTFTPAPGAPLGNSPLVTLTGASWRFNDGGTDLGTTWREFSYDDSQAGWASGTGLFGFTPDAAAFPAPIQTPLAVGRTTYYLRTYFAWTNDPASAVLVASNYLSDGAVFYLNGAEVKRVRLTNDPVLFNSPATGSPVTKGQAEVTGFSTAPLVIGTNVLAVEVHQTGGDSADLVFGMSLLAAPQFPVSITDPSQPVDREVVAGQPTTFAVELVGTAPLSYQWFKDGNPILNATNATFTINPVLQNDAGSYSIRISNPLATNVTSRAAVLTVTGVPVKITDSSQPADQTVTEGEPAIFSVVATGSAPLTYQWFKGAVPITDATNSTYTIDSALQSDASDYSAIVSNTLPSVATSRTAHLSVNPDTAAPTIVNVVGTPNKVTLTFSEPVTQPSANAVTNYSLSGGLIVNSAVRDATNPSDVVLTTSAQTLGASYTLTLNKVLDLFNNAIAPDTKATFKSTIVIDGSFTDWAGVPLANEDPKDTTESTDYKDVYIASDADYLYLRVTLYSPSDLAIFYNNIYIDADNDATTGYQFRLGSEMLIQGGGGYQEKNGLFNEGEISGLDWAIAPEGVGTEFELRISRHAKYVSDGLPVFTGDSIALVLESENTSFLTRDTAPDSGGLIHFFDEGTPVALGPLSIRLDSGQVTITWSGATGRLQSRQSLTTGSWQDVPNPTNPYTFQPTQAQGFFRLAQ